MCPLCTLTTCRDNCTSLLELKHKGRLFALQQLQHYNQNQKETLNYPPVSKTSDRLTFISVVQINSKCREEKKIVLLFEQHDNFPISMFILQSNCVTQFLFIMLLWVVDIAHNQNYQSALKKILQFILNFLTKEVETFTYNSVLRAFKFLRCSVSQRTTMYILYRR